MRIILRILLLLLVIALVASLILPKEMEVQQSMTIDAPASKVFSQVNNLKNWEGWSPWAKLDPNTEWTYGTPVSGKGAHYSWSSENENVGKGKLTITESVPNKSINTEIDFGEMGTGQGSWSFTENNGKTDVTWGMKSAMPWPFNLMQIFIEPGMKGTFKEGLESLSMQAKK